MVFEGEGSKEQKVKMLSEAFSSTEDTDHRVRRFFELIGRNPDHVGIVQSTVAKRAADRMFYPNNPTDVVDGRNVVMCMAPATAFYDCPEKGRVLLDLLSNPVLRAGGYLDLLRSTGDEIDAEKATQSLFEEAPHFQDFPVLLGGHQYERSPEAVAVSVYVECMARGFSGQAERLQEEFQIDPAAKEDDVRRRHLIITDPRSQVDRY